MLIRSQCCGRTSKLALLFNSSCAMSSMNAKNKVEGSETFSEVNYNTRQGGGVASLSLPRKTANQDVVKTSINCSKQADLKKVGSSPSVTERQCGGMEQNDQLFEPVLQRDDELDDTGFTRMLEEHCLPTSFGKKESFKHRNLKSADHSSKHVPGSRNQISMHQKKRTTLDLFDICQCENEGTETSNSSRDVDDNVEEFEVDELIEEPRRSVLRRGMVLLKKYISAEEQVSVVTKCRELGLGPGGFYHPGYKDGTKLRLRMMCLGLDWDPQTRKYQKRRRIDKSKPPDIPSEFHSLVTRAMQDSLSLIRQTFNVSNSEKILPQMTPDVCIVNFYTETGRLGLHQDRDESEESLSKGLPVVSFSVGDTAEFLYGDLRDTNKAEKLVLESGDVLIFGGESRHVFHGISSIIPHSAPPFLREQTMLRPGRLNLTFRQY
ncbi:hypothetical protein vseg_010872 [Gypsophila vaccaria]